MARKGRTTLWPLALTMLLLVGNACAEPGKADADPAGAAYKAAVQQAAEGDLAAGLASLRSAVNSGYDSYFSLKFDGALKPLRDAPGWPAFMDDFSKRHPWTAALDSDMNAPGFPWLAYAKASRAMATGHEPPASLRPTYLQMHAYLATLVGEYAEGSRLFMGGLRTQEAGEMGIVSLQPALGPIAKLAADRRVVMVNEPHGHSHVRAVNFLLLRELKKLGFTHLALEALSHEPAEGDDCRATRLADHELHDRGHAVLDTGYYTNDPIFAEIVRVALAEGFTLVAYDFHPGAPLVAEREQKQAENLACLMREQPDARLVVMVGGSHHSELPDYRFPGGMMGARFAALTGIDPLTITTGVGLLRGQAADDAGAGFLDPARDGALAGQPYMALTPDGNHYTRPGFDLALFAPEPAGRDIAASWLTLGGHRSRTLIEAANCGEEPLCLVQARRVGESADSVPADRCVSRTPGASCALFLPAGDYLVTASSDEPEVLATIRHSRR